MKKRTAADWERLALNTFCPYCGAGPGRKCTSHGRDRIGALERPHKTRVTAVKKGAAP
jgi:hypothetical protein